MGWPRAFATAAVWTAAAVVAIFTQAGGVAIIAAAITTFWL